MGREKLRCAQHDSGLDPPATRWQGEMVPYYEIYSNLILLVLLLTSTRFVILSVGEN